MLAHFLAVALSFPCVVYTVLLGIAIVYWLFVMIGAVHLDGGDGAVDGALDGAGAGAADGIDGGGHADAGGHADGADGDLGDGGDGAHHGALAAMMASLKLRSAPATLVLSVIVLFSWLFSVFGMQASAAWVPEGLMGLARFAVLFLSPVLALPLTSIAVRPLAKIFVPTHATKNESLVGKVCTVRTGTVTDRFGEALLEDGGAGLVVRVRVDTGETLKRGDQVVIVGYDDDRQEFTVAPMDNVLDDDRARR
ncbi:MAG: hypothetical protein JWP87_3845 [Labilithrix sp.]|nr:hypothetical protein [Labilithrix sp.]